MEALGHRGEHDPSRCRSAVHGHPPFWVQPVEVVCKRKGHVGFAVQPTRWIAERTLGWLHYYRRLSKEYEELPATSETMIRITMIYVMLGKFD
jgi:putative transposase